MLCALPEQEDKALEGIEFSPEPADPEDTIISSLAVIGPTPSPLPQDQDGRSIKIDETPLHHAGRAIGDDGWVTPRYHHLPEDEVGTLSDYESDGSESMESYEF